MVVKKKHHWLAIALVGVGLLVLSFGLRETEPPKLELPEHIRGVVIDSPATQIPDFALTNQNGDVFRKANLKNKWTLMFFGYTNCPDVCPMSLRVLDGVSNQDNLPLNSQFVFTTVDPSRDTQEKMKDFVSYFNEDLIGLTGDKAEIDKLAEPLGVIYDYEGDVASGDYIVNHFAAVYIFDPQARMRAYILPPHDVQRVTEVFRLVSSYYGK